MKRFFGFLALLMALAVIFTCGFSPSSSLSDSLSETWEERVLKAADTLEEDGSYTDLDHVAAYLVFYGELPANYMTRDEAKKLGWKNNRDLWKYAPGASIGGDAFGNREGLLPEGDWYECDLFYAGGERGEQRLVYNDEGVVYYSGDGFKSFVLVYPSDEEALIPNAAAEKEPAATPEPTKVPGVTVDRNGTYSDKEHVALYIHLYGKLPSNYITKSKARSLGWQSTSYDLWKVAPGCSIGGDHSGLRMFLVSAKRLLRMAAK